MALEEIGTLEQARAAIDNCRRCPLYRDATQGVFGEGAAHAPVMLVGEQPGDQEDRRGRPFVGPAGKILDEALAESGIDRRKLYVTNAVKHFKHERAGKRRLHKRPNTRELDACRFWLGLERALVRPKIIVALGATALQSLMGRAATVSSLRGKTTRLDAGEEMIATIHPSYLLRIREEEDKARERAAFIADLKHVLALAPEVAFKAGQ